GPTLIIASTLTALSFVHILFVRIPEETIAHDPELQNKKVDIKGSIAAIRAIPGLFGLIIFSMLNNFIGGVYMALMDPYGLTLFSVEMWGIVFGVAGTGFIAGGILVAKFGLGKNPVRTLLRMAIVMGLLGAFFTIREWWLLYAVGIWLYMVLIPVMEAAEQTIIQKVVPYKRQGRVFGLAQAAEAAAAPLTAFAIAPLAQFWVLPAFENPATRESYSWLLGTGEVRGIALIFLVSGLIMVALALWAFGTKTYKRLSKSYQSA
ncbi:MAG: MFS transporter, partial [Microbacterium sp.]|nr:MFS transporter [Microbacterium sp.]